MSTNSSVPPGIVWSWVIEALANFEEVDLSTLIDIVKRAPAISSDVGKNAREMVALRILENLFVQGNETAVDTDSGQKDKIGFDPSKCCEDVLRQILGQKSELSQLTESEKQKWDVRPFISSKRSSLPKCSLKKLKEMFLEGSDPLLASLKEKCKFIVANRSEDISTAFHRNSVDQTTVGKDDLVSPEIGDDNVRENQLQEANPGKNCVGETTKYTRREENEMSIGPPVEGLDGNTSMDHGEHASSKKAVQSCEVANVVHDDDGQQLPDNNDNMLQDTYAEGQEQMVSTDSLKKLEVVEDADNSSQPNASNGGPTEPKDSIEHDGPLETGTNRDRSDDGSSDIATKIEAFLSSQCILSKDSMAMTDWSWTEINLCMKCNEGGELLVCSSDACALQVHESCLGFASTLDENGKFFCPFCSYSRAISKYLEVKRKASMARKDLHAFCSLGVERGPKRSARNSGTPLGENMEAEDSRNPANGANNGNCFSNKEDAALAKSVVSNDPSFREQVAVSNAEQSVMAEPSRGCANRNAPSRDNGVSVANGTACGLAEGESVGQRIDGGSKSPTSMDEQQLSSQAVSGCEPRTPSSKGDHSDLRTGEHQLRSGCNQPNTDSIEKPILQPSTPTKTFKQKESVKSVSPSSSYTRNLRKRKAQYTYPAIPSLRRKILPWTKAEEEKLKEGVQRFSDVNHKGTPWTEILEFGRDVFHKGRTTIDLKDKWRNICRGTP